MGNDLRDKMGENILPRGCFSFGSSYGSKISSEISKKAIPGRNLENAAVGRAEEARGIADDSFALGKRSRIGQN